MLWMDNQSFSQYEPQAESALIMFHFDPLMRGMVSYESCVMNYKLKHSVFHCAWFTTGQDHTSQPDQTEIVSPWEGHNIQL